MTEPICPCDGAHVVTPTNLPALPHIAYRAGTYADFRRAALTPLDGEQTLSLNGVPVWRTDGAGDLAVMVAEWFAYIADILTFYNERIANAAYLRTAELPESVNHLIALLGYRPRPAIGATGVVAALVTPGQITMLPKGLRFQSKPTPGQAPQTFELSQDTMISPPDQIPAAPPPVLLAQTPGVSAWTRQSFTYRAISKSSLSLGWMAPIGWWVPQGSYGLLLNGAVTGIDPGAHLVLRPRDSAVPLLATVQSASAGPAPGGGQQTTVSFSLSGTPPDGLSAAQASLERPNQSASLWSLFGGAISGSDVHMAGLTRQIRPGDRLLFTNASGSALLKQVKTTSEAIWDANGTAAAPTGPQFRKRAVPMPHTVLTLAYALPSSWGGGASGVTVHFGWSPVGTLKDQPFAAWSGTPTTLSATTRQAFPKLLDQPILLQDQAGNGIKITGSSDGDASLTVADLHDPVPSLQPPFVVLPNVLSVTRGKSVANEVLGSGDATNSAQSFKLSQSPVTYLRQGAGWASTVSLTVGGQPWTEVAHFYRQAPDATVFVTYEDDAGYTHVQFGDGVNGARLPTGHNNVAATYRVGAGAASPPAGKLTVIAQSYPGLRAVLNPVAVGGGTDADPPDQVRHFAPRSALTFGRAVSVFDYEAIAAQTPGVTRASAVWAWDDSRQRALVTVYVGDDTAAVTAAKAALASAGDPNRPVRVVAATQIPVVLKLTLVTVPGIDSDAITTGVATALTDTETGLFGAWTLGPGQPVFDSQIEAAVLAVPGAVAITASSFQTNGTEDAGPLHNPSEGCFYILDPADLTLTAEPDTHGG